MARTTVYNNITTEEKISQINPDNIMLKKEFLEYLVSIDRSQGTIKGYDNDLDIFFCWNLEANKNKSFAKLTKREISRFQGYAMNEWGWSSNRIRRVKSALSSLSNYIANILDEEEEFEDFKPIIRKIETPVKTEVREKTVMTEEEVQLILKTLVERKKYQAACAIALAVYCGCRKAELARFKVDYFKDENIIFDGAMYKTSEKIKTKGRGAKLGKQLIKYTLIDFKPYFELWMKQREELGINSEWLFVTVENGEYVQAKISTFNSYAVTASSILGKPFYFHCNRHYLCTKMVKNNIPTSIILEFFGWSSSDMIQIYCDLEASDSFGAYFSSKGIIKQEQKSMKDV